MNDYLWFSVVGVNGLAVGLHFTSSKLHKPEILQRAAELLSSGRCISELSAEFPSDSAVISALGKLLSTYSIGSIDSLTPSTDKGWSIYIHLY
jgi:hypothetical protein